MPRLPRLRADAGPLEVVVTIVTVVATGSGVLLVTGIAASTLVTTVPRLGDEKRLADAPVGVFEPRASTDCDADGAHCLTIGDIRLNGEIVMRDVASREVTPVQPPPVGRQPTQVTLVPHGELYDVYFGTLERYDEDVRAVRDAALWLAGCVAFAVVVALLWHQTAPRST